MITDPATGLHQMRARWYSSYLHRFLNEDPSGFAGGENFYAYANGSPLALIDPEGLRAESSGRNSASLLTGGNTWVEYAHSSDLQRAIVPGQEAYDNMVNSALNGKPGNAALWGASMVANVAAAVVTAGSAKYITGVKSAFGAVSNSGKSTANIVFKTQHVTEHLTELNMPAQKVEAAIKESSSTGSFWGRVSVGRKTVEYRAFTLPDGTVNIGTYYLKK